MARNTTGPLSCVDTRQWIQGRAHGPSSHERVLEAAIVDRDTTTTMTQGAVAADVGCSPSYVEHVIKGIPVHQLWPPPRANLTQEERRNRDAQIALLFDAGVSLGAIGLRYEISDQLVSAIAKTAGCAPRNGSDQNPAFAKRNRLIVGEVMASHVTETSLDFRTDSAS